MKKKNLKKKMVIALAGIILAGSVGWNQIPVQAAVDGVNDCSHKNKSPMYIETQYISYGLQGHMERTYKHQDCYDCKNEIYVEYEYGNLVAHELDHWLIEDLHNGLYNHGVKCTKCDFEDEVLSDSPYGP